jgi:ABC-type branched-subunit amino acid transport system substrate-binding protein
MALSLVVMATLACGGGSPPSATQKAPVKIGTVLPLTGSPAGVAGTYLQGIKAYFAYTNANGGINGAQIDHIVVDDGFEIPRTISGYRQLAQQDKVSAVIGPYGTTNTLALLGTASLDTVPMVGPIAFANALYSPTKANVFSLWPGFGSMDQAMATYLLKTQHKTTFAILARLEAAGDEAIAGVKTAMTDGGGQLIATVRYPLGTTDYTGVLRQAVAGNPEVLFLYVSSTELIKALQDLQRIGYRGIVADSVSSGEQRTVSLAGASAEGMYGQILVDTTTANPGWARYSEWVTKAGGDPTQAFTADGYAAAEVVVTALKSINGEITPSTVRASLNKLRNAPTLAGPISFDAKNHLGVRSVSLTQVRSGKVTPIGVKVDLPI